jgi:hypothetical protein
MKWTYIYSAKLACLSRKQLDTVQFTDIHLINCYQIGLTMESLLFMFNFVVRFWSSSLADRAGW